MFGIEDALTADNADEIYDKCNAMLEGCSARSLMRQFHVKAVCTTDDPCDEGPCGSLIVPDIHAVIQSVIGTQTAVRSKIFDPVANTGAIWSLSGCLALRMR